MNEIHREVSIKYSYDTTLVLSNSQTTNDFDGYFRKGKDSFKIIICKKITFFIKVIV